MNVYVSANGYDIRDSAGLVVMPRKTLAFPVTTSAALASISASHLMSMV